MRSGIKEGGGVVNLLYHQLILVPVEYEEEYI